MASSSSRWRLGAGRKLVVVAAPRVIIVDDQRDISRMLRAALETLGRGFVIVDVPSAEEAQLEFRRGPVDLLITDLRLPGISGLELIRRLHKASSEARMIVISGSVELDHRAVGACTDGADHLGYCADAAARPSLVEDA